MAMDHIDPKTMGTFTVSPSGSFEVCSFQTFVMTVQVGIYGMDDKSSVRFVFHGAKDYSEPQTTDPTGPGYVTATTSDGKPLEVTWSPFLNERPWYNTLEVRLVEGGLRPGDEICVVLGDTSQGSPGFRLQTYCQDAFKFRAMINPFSTQQFFPLAELPEVEIVASAPADWIAVLPTLRSPGEVFSLKLKAEDIWGNPTNKAVQTLHFRHSLPVNGLPYTADYQMGDFTLELDDLAVDQIGDLVIDLLDDSGVLLCRSNPMRISSDRATNQYWGDLHGQTGETIGTNSAWRYFQFARDKGFLDVCSHQGNDIQITDELWSELNEITAEFDEPGRFLAIPGYEWSGNSVVGGDRNIWFRREGEVIHRAHRALVPNAAQPEHDCHHADILFETLLGERVDVAVAAHCGGRYADIAVSHDGRLENSVEIHSAWGTFEWILRDAFEKNYRVGIGANSDGHKGRPGASYPGDSFFTSKGGYTCFLMHKLHRDDLFEAMRRRHHYATTGTRIYLDTRASFAQDVTLFDRDPVVFPEVAKSVQTRTAMMGDILTVAQDCSAVTFDIDVTGSAPLERVELVDGGEVIRTFRPNAPDQRPSRTIRLIWQGAQYRGRGRNMKWQGTIGVHGTTIEDVQPVNFWSPVNKPVLTSRTQVTFNGLTAGNQQGMVMTLADAATGVLLIDTNRGRFEVDLASLGSEDKVFPVEGLDASVSVSGLSDQPVRTTFSQSCEVSLKAGYEARLYARITQIDGHQAWSSPIYIE